VVVVFVVGIIVIVGGEIIAKEIVGLEISQVRSVRLAIDDLTYCIVMC
jgi:hypothetical protein